MACIRSGIVAALVVFTFQGPVLAQSDWPGDPFSELAHTFGSGAPMSADVPQHWERRATVDAVQHKPISIPRRAKSVGQARVIRAKAEVTIIDRDHVVVTLTRPGIGDVNSTSGPRLRR